MVAAGLVLVIVAEPLIVLLYEPAFQPTASVVMYLLPGLVIGGVCGILANYFHGVGRANIIPRVQVLPVALQLLLASIFLQWWCLMVGIAAISIGLSLYGLMLVIVFVRVSKVSYPKLIPCLSDLSYLIAFARVRMYQVFKSKVSTR
tara:strand:- start:1700 stop:2140 length:441 start_codon:yes stop_codon:yes gene_type:complete